MSVVYVLISSGPGLDEVDDLLFERTYSHRELRREPHCKPARGRWLDLPLDSLWFVVLGRVLYARPHIISVHQAPIRLRWA